MIPVVTIVGRPNVGKSTLFNRLTKTRAALVADMPGVTRDRQYGDGLVGDRPYIVVDTGGIAETSDPEMAEMTDQQVMQAIEESNHLLFMVDARDGLTTADQNIAKMLRAHRDKVTLIVNKSDRLEAAVATSEFFALGFGEPQPISATLGRGIESLMMELLANYPIIELPDEKSDSIHVAVIGRPNVGKSTLINRILGEERLVTMDRPGTTRDSIFVPFEREGQKYTLIDTAGIRRRARVSEVIEKYSIIKALEAIRLAHVVIVMMDAHEAITDQDLRLIGKVIEMGKSIILAFNKWDNLSDYDKEQFKQIVDRKLPFADFARRYYLSALHGSGVGKLYHAIDETYEAASQTIATPQLTRALEAAVTAHQPPLVNGRRIKLRYAHLGGHHPMIFIIHGKQVTRLPDSYKRFLNNHFRKTFNLVGVPLIIKFLNDDNPYNNS